MSIYIRVGIFHRISRKVELSSVWFLKFIVGPAVATISYIAVGLHGDVLRVPIIQVIHK